MADKKLNPQEGVEIPEDILDDVAGGAYTTEEWNAMTTKERQMAQQRSIQAKIRNLPCEMD